MTINRTVQMGGTLPTSTVVNNNLAAESNGNLEIVAKAQGTDGTNIPQPAGGTGIRGWLSGIYQRLLGTLNVTGTVTVSNLGDIQTGSGGAVTITGTVPVTGTFYQATQPISGTVAVSNFPSTQAVTGTFWQATQPVSFSSLPAGSNVIGAVTQSGTWTVNGSVSVSNLPSTQAVTGTFWQATQPISATSLPLPTGAATAALQPALNGDGGSLAHVTNFPSTQAVTGTFWQATQPISGSVSVSNFPGTQPVSGTFWQATQPVSATSLPLPTGASTAALQPALDVDGGAKSHITNFPSTQAVTGTFWQATQPVSGSVSISNFPGTQPVSGTVALDSSTLTSLENISVVNFPATQTVAGTVSLDSTAITALNAAATPVTQVVSATALPLPTGATTEATAIELLSEMSLLLIAILDRLPRVDANDRVVINSSDQGNVTVAVAAAQTLATVTTVTTAADVTRLNNMGTSGVTSRPADAIPVHISNAGSIHIYDKIVVS